MSAKYSAVSVSVLMSSCSTWPLDRLDSYAARHGYELALETTLPDPSRPASWNKLRVVSRLLDDFDLVFWIDSDAIVLRCDVDIADVSAARVEHRDGRDETPEAEEFPERPGVFVCRSSWCRATASRRRVGLYPFS